MADTIGIDLGTTFSCVGVFQHGKVEIIANDMGNRTTPSYVAFTDEERLIGDTAKAQSTYNTQNTVFGVKRLIGRKFTDDVVQSDIEHWPFTVINDDNTPKIRVEFKGETKVFTSQEISSMVLTKMKETAEAYIGNEVHSAVITVPAYFSDAQRQATKDAGTIAGLRVLRIINEPTAAALAYGLHKDLAGDKNVLVFDLGGGTFDVSILKISEGTAFEVLSTSGDTHLGGEDFDTLIVNHFVDEFRRKHKKNLKSQPRPLRRLRAACERAKRVLSNSSQANVEVDSLFEGVDFYSTITRAKFEQLCGDLFQKTIVQVENAINDARLNKAQISDVVLVGGSSRIPKVQKMLKEYMNGMELNRTINPDEAVAYGATVQAAIINGTDNEHLKDVILLDVTPLSLGIETAGGVMTNIINRNTRVPATAKKTFSTYQDNQEAVGIKVFEGERMLTKDNHLLAKINFGGLTPRPRGIPQIDVSFNVDADGILHVTALDVANNTNKKVTITNDRETLSKTEVKRMVAEARQYEQDDKIQRAKTMAKNQLEQFVYDYEITVDRDDANKIPIEHKQFILSKCAETMDWIKDHEKVSTEEDYSNQARQLQQTLLHTGVVIQQPGSDGAGYP